MAHLTDPPRPASFRQSRADTRGPHAWWRCRGDALGSRSGPYRAGHDQRRRPRPARLGGTDQPRGAGPRGHDVAAGEIWLDDWDARIRGPMRWTLTLRLSDQLLRLRLEPRKTPLAPTGEDTAGPRGLRDPAACGQRKPRDGRDGAGAWRDRVARQALGRDTPSRRAAGPGPSGAAPVGRGGTVASADTAARRARHRHGRRRFWWGRNGGATLPRGWGRGPDFRPAAGRTARCRDRGASPAKGWTCGSPFLAHRGRRVFALPVRVGQLEVEGTRQGMPVEGAGTVLLSGGDGT